MVRIGLWKNTTKNDKTYIGGNNEFILIPPGAFLSIWPNDEKTKPNQPDFWLNVSEPKQRQEAKNEITGPDHIPF